MPPIVGLLTVELLVGGARSLKDKRMVLRRVKDRLQRFNVSVAEVDHLDLWQRGALAVSAVANDRDVVEQTLSAVVDEIDRVEPGLVVRSEFELLT
jgi:uncharacterized protein